MAKQTTIHISSDEFSIEIITEKESEVFDSIVKIAKLFFELSLLSGLLWLCRRNAAPIFAPIR